MLVEQYDIKCQVTALYNTNNIQCDSTGSVMSLHNDNNNSTHPEVWGTGRQDHPVSSDKLAVSGEGDVHQTLLLQETVHDREDGGGVVVPFQTELLAHPVTSSTTRSHYCASELSQSCLLKIFCLFLCFILGAQCTGGARYKKYKFPQNQFLSFSVSQFYNCYLFSPARAGWLSELSPAPEAAPPVRCLC